MNRTTTLPSHPVLLTQPAQRPAHGAIGKTLVSSSMIDRGREETRPSAAEVPVGSNGWRRGLFDGSFYFVAKRVPVRAFLRHDRNGLDDRQRRPAYDLLAAEITAVTGTDPGVHFRELTREFGRPYYYTVSTRQQHPRRRRASRNFPRRREETKLAGETTSRRSSTRAAGNTL